MLFIQAIISMLIPMTYHIGIRQTLIRVLKKRQVAHYYVKMKTSLSSVRPVTTVIWSLDGERLNFKPEHEMEIYFTVRIQCLDMTNSPLLRLLEIRGTMSRSEQASLEK